jgi:dTDP-4-amino-4,6-dideoxygalactose transaminase
MRERGVEVGIGTFASHLQPVYGDTAPCPESARLFRSQMAIPMHANLSTDEVDVVVATLFDVLESR